MKWTTPFIIYRIGEDSQLAEVSYPNDLVQAKYWMKYIAETGDVCCRTPLHPKHATHGGAPEYFSHKNSSGVASSNEAEWRKFAVEKKFSGGFPAEQIAQPNDRRLEKKQVGE